MVREKEWEREIKPKKVVIILPENRGEEWWRNSNGNDDKCKNKNKNVVLSSAAVRGSNKW
jgi:hypothetical protein